VIEAVEPGPADTTTPNADDAFALFPLGTVLFPGGPLTLRIFEARYLDMVSECLRRERPFGVCLIEDGYEVGAPADTVAVGTLASIKDWYQYNDGMLGIITEGGCRFRVMNTEVRGNGLVQGRIEFLAPEPTVSVPESLRPLAKLARKLIDRAGPLYGSTLRHYDDASWLGYRLAELLPLPLTQKQAYLEMSDPLERLESLDAMDRVQL